MQHTLVAVFDNRSDAQNAMDELLASGFSRSDVNVSSADPTGETNSVTGSTPHVDETHEHGIAASIKHFFTGLFGADNDEHVSRYSDAVTRGHHVLTLTTDSEPEVERAADVIERFGPVDIDERHDLNGSASSLDPAMLASGASSGSKLQQSSSMQSSSAGSTSYGSDTGSLGVSSSNVGTGSLGSTQSSTAGTQPGSLQGGADEDRNFFQMQNINDPVPKGTTYQEPMGGNMQAGGSLDSTTGGNVLSGTQSSSLNSGLSDSRQTSQGGSLSQSDSVLQGTASLQGSDDRSLGGTIQSSASSLSGQSMQRDMSSSGSQQRAGMRVFSRSADDSTRNAMGAAGAALDSDSEYRSDWDRNYSSLGGSYDDYAPAYRYGSEARSKHSGRNWDDVESDLRSDWDTKYGSSGASTWEKFKAAVRHGWDKITPDMDDSDYRKDWQSNYSTSGGSYDDYAPAYRYGSEARNKYRGRDWSDVESDLRNDWDTKYGSSGASTWEKFKAAVRHGWDKITPDMDDSDNYYRNHWSSTYGASNDTYNDYEPAYRYGNEMRSSDKYRGRDWNDVESDLRSDWDTRYPGGSGVSTWEKMKAAVRHGWDRMTS